MRVLFSVQTLIALDEGQKRDSQINSCSMFKISPLSAKLSTHKRHHKHDEHYWDITSLPSTNTEPYEPQVSRFRSNRKDRDKRKNEQYWEGTNVEPTHVHPPHILTPSETCKNSSRYEPLRTQRCHNMEQYWEGYNVEPRVTMKSLPPKVCVVNHKHRLEKNYWE